jgi:uncharacterized protein (TIGR02996 family)
MRLYRIERGHTKTWRIDLEGKKVTSISGGDYEKQTKKTKTYGSPAKAKQAHDELVAEQREDGWRALGELAPPSIPIVRDPGLEAELRKDHADPAPYLVYADWLQGQGSPLGEMLVLAQRKKAKQAAAIATKIGLPSADMAKVGWRFGLWQWLHLDNQVDNMAADFDAVAFAKGLFSSPLCAALEELRIGMLRWEGCDDPDVIVEAGKHAWAKDLVRLRVGDVDKDIDMAHHGIGQVGKAITKAFPNLTSLWLRSGESYEGPETLGFAGLDLPRLTELTIETCAMSRKRMKSLIAAKLPALEKLVLWFGERERELATATVADIAPLWSGPQFPRVRHLGLCNTELVTDIVRILPTSKLAPQLESLDLSRGTLGDDDAAELAESAASYKKLTTLNVSRSWLSTASIRALKSAFKGKKIIADDQQEPLDPEEYGRERYVSVSE